MKKIASSFVMKYLMAPTVLALLFLVLYSSVGPNLLKIAHQTLESIGKRITVVTTPAPVIVERLQALNRMETARQVSRQIVEAKSNSTIFPDFLAKDDLQMMVQTEVVAGVDLSRMSVQDVRINDDAVTVVLPSPELFTVHIDDENSKVFSRERGIFMFHPDKDLERQARLQGQANARQAAQSGDLMDTARTNAESNLRNLLTSLGFNKINFKWASTGSVAST